MVGKINSGQFDELVHMIRCIAELEARKVHCEMSEDDYEVEQDAACTAISAARESLVQNTRTGVDAQTYKERLSLCHQHLNDARKEIDRLRVQNEMCKSYHTSLQQAGSELGLDPGANVVEAVVPAIQKLHERMDSMRHTLERQQDTSEALAEERDKLKQTVQALRGALTALGE